MSGRLFERLKRETDRRYVHPGAFTRHSLLGQVGWVVIAIEVMCDLLDELVAEVAELRRLRGEEPKKPVAYGGG